MLHCTGPACNSPAAGLQLTSCRPATHQLSACNSPAVGPQLTSCRPATHQLSACNSPAVGVLLAISKTHGEAKVRVPLRSVAALRVLEHDPGFWWQVEAWAHLQQATHHEEQATHIEEQTPRLPVTSARPAWFARPIRFWSLFIGCAHLATCRPNLHLAMLFVIYSH